MRQHLNNCEIHKQTNKQTHSQTLSFVQNRTGQDKSGQGIKGIFRDFKGFLGILKDFKGF